MRRHLRARAAACEKKTTDRDQEKTEPHGYSIFTAQAGVLSGGICGTVAQAGAVPPDADVTFLDGRRILVEMKGLTGAALLLPVALTAAGCAGSRSADVQVTIDHGSRGSVRYTLSCPSGKGDFPNAATACKKIASSGAMLHPPKMTATCAGSEGIPPEIRVKGTADHEQVGFALRSCDEPSARAQAARDWLALVRSQ